MLSQPNGGIDTWQHTLHIISPPKCACAWPPPYPQVIFSFMLVILVTLCCCPRAVQHWQLHWRAGGTLYFHTHYVLLIFSPPVSGFLVRHVMFGLWSSVPLNFSCVRSLYIKTSYQGISGFVNMCQTCVSLPLWLRLLLNPDFGPIPNLILTIFSHPFHCLEPSHKSFGLRFRSSMWETPVKNDYVIRSRQ